ncbi:hypothetical protein GOP47_0029823 [Adiantum capillus-veneris]|nr:hypothetical protein GOP47_0029823 [Adiantum capillus-veneris]
MRVIELNGRNYHLHVLVSLLIIASTLQLGRAEDPTQYLEWNVTYGQLSPLGVPKQVILINNAFPGPIIETTTNNVVYVNVFNNLDEPLLFTWNGIQQRRNSWQDGTLGTNCPILPGQNWTYAVQYKDQIGSFFYYPSTYFQKAAGAYGGISIAPRFLDPAVKVPFDPPTAEFTILIGDWYHMDHKSLREILDNGSLLQEPDGVLINGQGPNFTSPFLVSTGLTYRFRISNVGIATTLNFRIQGYQMLLVETEGTYVSQEYMESLDIHVGQSFSILLTINDTILTDVYIVASSRFTTTNLTALAILRSNASTSPPFGPIPLPLSPQDFSSSLNQTLRIRMNLTAGAARPNPQGSFHYGEVNVTRIIKLVNNMVQDDKGLLKFAINGWSFVQPDTPLKLADYFNLTGIFQLGTFPDTFNNDSNFSTQFGAPVIAGRYKQNMTELIFQNNEPVLQSWHLDGYAFFVVGLQSGEWTPESRASYNLIDAISRSTIEVYPMSWTTILVMTDNKGMWNLRSQHLQRQYLGQEVYIRIVDDLNSTKFENPIPSNVLLCGRDNLANLFTKALSRETFEAFYKALGLLPFVD